ncbi:hypothetical protein GWR56_06470 [Mucilaginibacter sp. 14171R-50]|uniref:hypothetical protein n=1 Tax=Mucilaginibacter sp. 14171R-50 TaxID=2703789 RepID=UPI00138D1021|nr:hypothetical protein [Mucilaginibacter sp. 14171R-50]QHS55200.1 hypothetical protein GWR56_06470 [Mucilaginibacter sp. 14171R-50]
MQPLNLMNNVAKARLLHNLLREEIPEFLGYLNELSETVLNDKERIRAEWNNGIMPADMWFKLAEQIQAVIAKYPKDLYRSANVFSDQLFDGFLAIFTRQALYNYTQLEKHTDPKFKPAVELLFT